MSENSISDAVARQHALDPTQSFIVQAPAGSGKTGLLIQRYLRLLACVDEPEEIIAITFTRKAAIEMRERILAALGAGKIPAIVDNAYAASIHALSVAALQQDNEKGWQITDNPVRLRIQTIDSLCASLTRQMPLLSKFGSQPESIEDASDLYLEAARATIALIEKNNSVAEDVTQLYIHLDNDSVRIERLLTEMLARRDHWLRHIHSKTRDELEAALRNVRYESVMRLLSLYPDTEKNELFALAEYSLTNLLAAGKDTAMTRCNNFVVPIDQWGVAQWCGIGELLLTQKGEWRKTLTVNNGFPAGKNKAEKEVSKSWKARVQALIDLLGSNDAFRQSLHAIRQLPPAEYTAAQWRVLGAMTRLLPYAVAQLKIIFQACGKVDFIEVSQSALQALGESEMPTDLALALDYRISHLLVDEFQDTAISQYGLVEKLTAGWEAGDGRSLFIVGDPMQSIYRFREAEVGLFLQVRSLGLGNVALQPLTLSANFRSQQGIVDWVNTTFARMMPIQEDVSTGAVPYSPSVATHVAQAVQGAAAVTIHPFFNNDTTAEAREVVDIILQVQHDNPSASIAVLVRNRSHLNEIVVYIKAADLRFRAIEIEALGNKPIVQDLLTLTRALINPADQIAWFALLRAPWCGLSLQDLDALAVMPITNNLEEERGNQDSLKGHHIVWERLNAETYLSGISEDGLTRLRRVCAVLAPCIQNRYRQSLRVTVEAAWQALGGPGCRQPVCQNMSDGVSDWNDAMIYLDYLETHESAGGISDIAMFQKNLAKLYASPDLDADDSLQIMTIHKAKGLEFDCVIVPGLGRSPRGNDKQLLKWMERPRDDFSSEMDLFLAPIQEIGGAEDDLVYAWIQAQDVEKDCLEAERLLYVAATRAKYFLHLLGSTTLAADKNGLLEVRRPKAATLLNKLWSTVEPIYIQAAEKLTSAQCGLQEEKNTEAVMQPLIDQSIYRLTADWVLPAAPSGVIWDSPRHSVTTQDEIEFSWVGDRARHIGSIVHRWLQKIAEDEMKDWNAARIQALRNTFKQALVVSGVSYVDTEFEQAVERIIAALSNAITDQRGQWILGPQKDAQNELCLTGIIKDERVNFIIDRTFCDGAGNRWIIDYKTSNHEGSDIEEFLQREQIRYRDQLNRYAVLMHMIDKRPIRLGLYFPLLKAWRTWEA